MIRVRMPSGKIELRRPRLTSFGNFVISEVKIDNQWKIVGHGDEYLRDDPDPLYELSPIYRRH